MYNCSRKRKSVCLPPSCKWIVGKGCRKNRSRSPISSCSRKRKTECLPPNCEWSIGRGCRGARSISPTPVHSPLLNDCISRSQKPLMPHQRAVVEWLNQHRGIIAVHQTGAGKTLAAVTASQCFLEQNPNGHVVVISPVTLLPNFQKEMLAYGMINEDDPRYSFYSYEKFMNETDHVTKCKDNMLIVDEAHELRTETVNEENEEGVTRFFNRAHKIIHCARHAERVLLLTATPYVNSSYDFANLLAMVKGTPAISKQQWNVLIEDEKETIEYFSNSFHYYDVPRTRENQYPEVHIHHKIIEMDDDFYQAYRDVETNLNIDYMNLNLTENATFLIRFRQALLRLPGSGKMLYAMKHIRKTLSKEPNAKIVVYSNFIKTGISQIAQFLEQEGIVYAKITGNIPNRIRQEIIDRYNTGEIRVLLISKAAQRGIDLKQTHSMIVLDVPWNPASLDQAIGRVARYQSHIDLPVRRQKVEVYVLYSKKPRHAQKRIQETRHLHGGEKPSVDIIMKEIIEHKRKESDEFMKLVQMVSIE